MRYRLVLALVLSVASFSAYWFTGADGPSVGVSAAEVQKAIGLLPRLSVANPVWASLASVVGGEGQGAVQRLNLVANGAGALAVGFLFWLMVGVVQATITLNAENQRRVGIAALLAGLCAAWFLAFSIPFWVVSNRAHPASFHSLWLVMLGCLLFRYYETQRFVWAAVFAFLLALGTVELATMWTFAPLAGLYLVYLLWRYEQLTVRNVLLLTALILLGWSAYFLAAWWFIDTPGFDVREYTGFWNVLWHTWRDQYVLIGKSLPTTGWLVVLIVAVAPWLAVLLVARRSLNEEKDWTYYVLHVMITLCALAVLFNSRLSPWRMTGLTRLLVTPSILMAMVYGYLAAYWFLLPYSLVDPQASPVAARQRAVLGPLLAFVMMGLVVWGGFKNAPVADARDANLINQYAREVVRWLDGRDWLVVSGGEDPHISVAAAETGKLINIINLSGQHNEAYMNYVGTMFAKPEYRYMARVGMMPLLQEWMRKETGVVSRIGVIGFPDLLRSNGLMPVPAGLVFTAVRNVSEVDAGQLMTRHEDFWKHDLPKLLDDVGTPDNANSRMVQGQIRKQAAMVANNLGVLLEDVGMPEQALQAYRQALAIDPSNLSALLNLVNMAKDDAGVDPVEKQLLESTLENVEQGFGARPDIWALSRTHGYVRRPEPFLQKGWFWVMSGQPGLASTGLSTALALSPPTVRDSLRETLADYLLSQHAPGTGEALFRQILDEKPADHKALLGLAGILVRQGKWDEADSFLQKAEQHGAGRLDVGLTRGMLLMKRGHLDQARVVLQEIVDYAPANSQAIALLADVQELQGDSVGVVESIRRLEQIGGQHLMVAILKARVAWQQRRWRDVSANLQVALRLQPENPQLMEWALRLAVIMVNQDSARYHARRLLRHNPQHALANYVMGGLYTASEELDLAEDAFRRSLSAARTPMTLNDLAWVRMLRGDLASAEKTVRESLALAEGNYQAWDTLGAILMRLERFPEADQAFQRSLSLFQGAHETVLHFAQLKLKMGDRGMAGNLVKALGARRQRLSLKSQRELDELEKQLK